MNPRIGIIGFTNRLRGRGYSGAVPVAKNLAAELIDSGIGVDFLVFQTQPGRNLPFDLPLGATIVDLDLNNRTRAIVQVRQYIADAAPQGIMSTGTRGSNILIALKKSRALSRAWISIHHPHSEEMKGWGFFRRYKRIRSLRAWASHADAIIAVSKVTRDDFIRVSRCNPNKVKVIYNPIVNSDLEKLANKPFDHPWFTRESEPVVLSMGRLAAPKDFFTLLESFYLVNTKIPCRLLILGEGEHRLALEKRIRDLGISDRVQLYGFTENPFVFIKKSSLLVLSSVWEGTPNVLVEAMALGTPVVSTNCGGTKEVLDNGRYGPLVSPKNAEALAGAMISVLNDPLDPDVLRYGARRFQTSIAAKRYMEVMGFTK